MRIPGDNEETNDNNNAFIDLSSSFSVYAS
jgi:hypothetical protein